jgi:glycosyltransferase involved in cell wall biosynthesis
VGSTRIAWLVPYITRGAYWLPILREFIKTYPDTKFYTGETWSGFSRNLSGAHVINQVGKFRFIKTKHNKFGYHQGVLLVSPLVIFPLLKFKPRVVFVSSFSIWTALAILLRLIGQWKLVLLYDGVSPNLNFQGNIFRTIIRRWMTLFIDNFISNSSAGGTYLAESLGVSRKKITVRPYLVPDARTLLEKKRTTPVSFPNFAGPVFLYVGMLTPRKGVMELLQACSSLQKRGYSNYGLVLVGGGEQRSQLTAFIRENDLEQHVYWTGPLNYDELGQYFQFADVFVFPTLEDIWGVVLLEAMASGKAVISSKWAGASELVREAENGYIVDPNDTKSFADAMIKFVKNRQLIDKMGKKSQELMVKHTVEEVGLFLAGKVKEIVTN